MHTKRVWIDEEVGYPCLILEGPLGSLNGYVAVSKDHPWYGLAYTDCPVGCGEYYCEHAPGSRIDVHGGVTYSGSEIGQGLGLDLPQDIFWYGFDTAHAGDIVPGLQSLRSLSSYRGGTLKDETYVTQECHRLAVQLSDLVK